MKKALIFTILAMLILAACGNEELPPTPPPPGHVGVGGAIAGLASALPTWASPAKNLAVTPTQVSMGDTVIVTASNYDYIYSNGYLFNSKSRTWERFSLQGDKVQDWIRGQAIGNLLVDPTRFSDGDNYLVVYACSKIAGAWDCNSKKWMLISFNAKQKAGAIPESANIPQYVINEGLPPFAILGTTAEYDNFTETGKTDPVAYVVRYDARYRESKGLTVLVHVFDFKNRQDLEKGLTLFNPILINGWKVHNGNNVALFLDENDHRVAVWSSGKDIIYVETHDASSANKEVIDAYLRKYPSDLKRPK